MLHKFISFTTFNGNTALIYHGHFLKTNDKIRKLTNDIFENWWIACSYRMLHMTEMASPHITFVWKMWGLEFQWLYHWSQWEYAIPNKRVERFCWNLLWLIKIKHKVGWQKLRGPYKLYFGDISILKFAMAFFHVKS